MKYNLLNNSKVGVLIDRTPIMGDIRDTYEVSFLLPENGSFIALFCGVDKIEYKKQITNGVCKIPKELIGKEQYVQLVVSQISEDKVLQSWECEPIKVTALLNMRRSQWQLSGGMTERNCFNRMVELESEHACLKNSSQQINTDFILMKDSLRETVSQLNTKILESFNALDLLKSQNKTMAENYNKAIDVINDLSNRLKMLEKNYDPTII